MILRLNLQLEIDTQEKSVTVISQDTNRQCPGPCGGTRMYDPSKRHCSVACRDAMKTIGREPSVLPVGVLS